MTFNDFVHEHHLKNKATSNIKIQQVHGSISLDDVEINLRDGSFESDIEIVNIHPSIGTHWVLLYKLLLIYTLLNKSRRLRF